jgi:hypothetical protein
MNLGDIKQILKHMLKSPMVWTGFSWLKVGTNVVLVTTKMNLRDSTKYEKLIPLSNYQLLSGCSKGT